MIKRFAVRGSILLFPCRYLSKSSTRQKNKGKISILRVIHICFVIEQEDKLIYTMINKYKMKF